MLAAQFHEAITAARNSNGLDELVHIVWKANTEGHIGDIDAEAVFGAIQARRRALAGGAIGKALGIAAAASAPRRRPRSPNRQASLERRRRQAAGGGLPPQLAAKFTVGELAFLTVVGLQYQQTGTCDWPIDKIAGLAGVSRSTAKRALRAAEAGGLLLRKERRRQGDRSLTNILTVVSPEWRAWLERRSKGGGGQKRTTTKYQDNSTGKKPGTSHNAPLYDSEIHAMFPKREPGGGQPMDGTQCRPKFKTRL